jgi:hypothetical protein
MNWASWAEQVRRKRLNSGWLVMVLGVLAAPLKLNRWTMARPGHTPNLLPERGTVHLQR